MGRRPCCEKEGLNKGAWTAVEDRRLVEYVEAHGEGKWGNVPKAAGLKRCGKSCRLRWLNYLRPDIKRGNISPDEEDLIVRLHRLLGNRWSLIAGRLPGRTDNEIKNYWNTTLSKKLISLNKINDNKQLEHQQPPVLAVAPKSSTRAVMSEKSSLAGKAADQMKSSSYMINTHYNTSRFVNTKSSSNEEEDYSWNFKEDELEMEFNLGDFAELGNISSTYVNNDDIAAGANSRNTDDENINFGPILECNLLAGDKEHNYESDDFPCFASLFDRSVADEDWLLDGSMFGSV